MLTIDLTHRETKNHVLLDIKDPKTMKLFVQDLLALIAEWFEYTKPEHCPLDAKMLAQYSPEIINDETNRYRKAAWKLWDLYDRGAIDPSKVTPEEMDFILELVVGVSFEVFDMPIFLELE